MLRSALGRPFAASAQPRHTMSASQDATGKLLQLLDASFRAAGAAAAWVVDGTSGERLSMSELGEQVWRAPRHKQPQPVAFHSVRRLSVGQPMDWKCLAPALVGAGACARGEAAGLRAARHQ